MKRILGVAMTLIIAAGLLMVAGTACESPLVDPISERPTSGYDSLTLVWAHQDSLAWDNLGVATMRLGEIYQLCAYAWRQGRVMGRGPAVCPNPIGRDVPIIEGLRFEIHQDSTVLEFVDQTSTSSFQIKGA